MAIEVELPDGTVVEFPDGTDQATMERALAQYAQQPPPQQARPPQEAPPDPTEGMGGWDRHRAGWGRSLVDTYQAAKQFVIDGAGTQQQFLGNIANALGADAAARHFYRNADAVVPVSKRQWEEEALRRQRDAPLMNTWEGKSGHVLGTLAQLVGPGVFTRGTMAAPAFLPRTVSGSALQGATVGALQPVATPEERATNAGLGSAAGGIGALLPRVVGTVARTTGAAVAPFTKSGQERIAGMALRESAVDPQAFSRVAPSAIPGVQRTLAEETADPGIAQLQRQFSVQLQPRAAANNAARAKAIRETFEGADDAAAMSIRAERDQAATEALRGLRTAGFVERRPIQQALEAAIKRHQGNPATQKALQEVLAEMPEIRTAEQAYNFRKYIDFVLSKQSDKPAARQASRELQTVKGLIDRSMSRAFPEWRSYLRDYRAASTRADQAKVGATLLDRARAAADPVTGERMFTPAKLARVTSNPDALVRKATRFPKARADRTLTPQQSGLLRALYDDASRMDAAANAGRAVGSNTAQNLATQNILRTVSGGSPLLNLLLKSEPAQRLTTGVEKAYGVFGVPARLQEVLVEALENPQRAREIIARLPAPDRVLLEQAIGRYTGVSGALSPALSE